MIIVVKNTKTVTNKQDKMDRKELFNLHKKYNHLSDVEFKDLGNALRIAYSDIEKGKSSTQIPEAFYICDSVGDFMIEKHGKPGLVHKSVQAWFHELCSKLGLISDNITDPGSGFFDREERAKRLLLLQDLFETFNKIIHE